MQTSRHAKAGAPGGPRAGFGLLLACLAGAVILGIAQGQDANWDLRNYHLYAPHALLHGRLDVDLAPAQVQTWLNPYWDCLYYWLATSGLDSRVTTGLLALPAGVALFVLALLARRLDPAQARGLALAAALAVAATGAAGAAVIGITMSDWHTVALVVGAMALALLAREPGRRRALLHGLAGLCAGAAVGLKLTAAPYALGLGVMILVMPGSGRSRLGDLAALSLGGIAGFAALGGPWAWELWRRYQNPFFPFFNDVFRSPLVAARSFRDERFLARGLGALVALPFRLVRTSTFLVSEVPLRDARLAFGFAALAWLAFARRAGAARPAWRGVLALYVLAYVLWAAGFGILRYVVVLEVLASLAAVMAVATLARGRLRPVAIVALAVALVGWTRWPAWGRIRHGVQAVRVELPPVPADALVVLATQEPLGYVAARLPPTVPAVALLDNFLDPLDPTPFDRQVLARIRGHAGPVLLLTKRDAAREVWAGRRVFDVLAALGLSPDMDRCGSVRSPMEDTVVLCPLARAGPDVQPAALAPPGATPVPKLRE